LWRIPVPEADKEEIAAVLQGGMDALADAVHDID
jgi:hypothetical protein